jgi:glyoxylase-like metal-dependent hydrolase (beta-lactamase superfamily II)
MIDAMILEDHLGDIIGKSRQALKLSPETVARIAGLSVMELASLETSGQFTKRPDFLALGDCLELDGRKLAALAEGWQPAPVDLSLWRELRQITTIQSGYAVNSYLVWDEVSREAALFDTGWEIAPVLSLVAENRLELKHLFITHSHDDHNGGINALREKFPKIRIHTGSRQSPVEQRNRANDFIHLGSLRITHRETPGHSEDGVTYIAGNFPEDAPHVAIVGDALFAGSIGRGFQSFDLLRQKVREQILSLPPATLVCPGHGPLTTVAQELAHNPFFK